MVFIFAGDGNNSPSIDVKKLDGESVKSLKFHEEIDEEDVPNDAFGGFQSVEVMTLRESHINEKSVTTSSTAENGDMAPKPYHDLKMFDALEGNVSNHVAATASTTADEEDDFSDFQMSLPPPSNEVAVNQAKTFDILQPTVLQPIKKQATFDRIDRKEEQSINWPDPGLSEEDLINIERSLKNLKTVNEKPKTHEDASKFQFLFLKKAADGATFLTFL